MSLIQVLDRNTINQIAAGEVIERPASVVKELLENAIDAKSAAVTVEIRDGGLSLIRVTDNGCGIPKEEVSLAFLRHATSKIRTAEDLITVGSLGFRGEALASIASVSRVEAITRTPGSISGTRYVIEGGEEKILEEVGAPEGTTFLVRDLFYNTPARRKFLKSAASEAAHVADYVEKIALSHPEVSIRFIQNNQNKLHTTGNHNLRDIIYTVYGKEIAANLIEAEGGNAELSVRGYIGKPVIARGNRSFENYFINGRFIRNPIIGKAIEEAYKPYMMQHKYPFTMLHFSIEPTLMDVNVHPAKMEVRFRNGEQLYSLIYHTLSLLLSEKELIPEVLPEVKTEKKPEIKAEIEPEIKPERKTERKEACIPRQETPEAFPEVTGKEASVLRPVTFPESSVPEEKPGKKPAASHPEPFEKKRLGSLYEEARQKERETEAVPVVREDSKPVQLDMFDDRLLSRKAREKHRLIGQVFDTYWMVEYKNSLYIIDQHAAHEKVLYERTMKTLETREYTSQQVNPPIILTLREEEALLLDENMDSFTAVGFEIEPFGGRDYAVRAVPANLLSLAKKDLLLEMIDDLGEDTLSGTPESVRKRIATMSCKAAVKGNNRLSPAEADKLIEELLTLDNPYMCPHGRPTIISMSKQELEKKFGRIVQ